MGQLFDVIVVGAGMMGSAAARHLSERGATVAIVGPTEPEDRHAYSGPFASHYDATRITRRLDQNRDWSRLSARSIARYRALEEATGVSFYHETGAVMAVAPGFNDPGLAARVREVNEREGIGADTPATGAFPYLSFPEGSAVWHEAQDAGMINPRAHVRAELAAAAARGAVRYDSVALSLSEARDGVEIISSDGQSVRGASVIVACGGYSRDAGLLPERLNLKVLARTVAFIELGAKEAARLADMPSIVYFPDNRDDDLYVLPPALYPDGRTYIKIGGDPVDRALLSRDEINAWFRSSGDTGIGRYLVCEMQRLIPGLEGEGAQVAGCMTTYTGSGVPLIYKQTERVFVLTGWNGAGAKNADEVGRLGATLVLDGTLAEEGYRGEFQP